MCLKLLKVFIPGALAIALIACAPTPIRNVENAPVVGSSPYYDLSEVTKAIQRAGISQNWQMKEVTPGHIVGTLYIRSHMASVDIVYTLDEFSIIYKSSGNLDYDPVKNTIHGNYNRWVQELTSAINNQLSSL